MKNVILFLSVCLFNCCTGQKTIASINDNSLVENIVSQFSKKAKIKIDNSVFALYFQENPRMTEVYNNKSQDYIYTGFNVTIYNFINKNQITEFTKDYDVYRKSENVFCVFNKNSDPKLLKNLKKNRLQILSNYDSMLSGNGSDYDPKSWVLTFDSNGILKKCLPYNCN